MELAPPNRDWQTIKLRCPPFNRRMPVSPGEQALGECILSVVANTFDTTVEQLKGLRRDRGLALARFAAVALLLEFCPGLSYPAIGRLIGQRDHTTIIHARQRARELMLPNKYNAPWRHKYFTARAKLLGEDLPAERLP